MEFETVIKKKDNPIEEPIEVKVEQDTNSEPDNIVPAATEAGADDDELQVLQLALGKAEQELVLHRDAMLRMQAEMENLRKRQPGARNWASAASPPRTGKSSWKKYAWALFRSGT